jgi:hypothetical protein
VSRYQRLKFRLINQSIFESITGQSPRLWFKEPTERHPELNGLATQWVSYIQFIFNISSNRPVEFSTLNNPIRTRHLLFKFLLFIVTRYVFITWRLSLLWHISISWRIQQQYYVPCQIIVSTCHSIYNLLYKLYTY